jgi:chromosome segregation ATPase
MSTPSNEHGAADGDESSDVVTSFGRRAPRISQADVFRAADELLVQGDRPTIDRVRMRLGRGSPNTINDHLDAWWSKLGARLRDLPGQEFPQLPERVAHSLQKLWNEALAGAHETLQGALAEREQALRQREADLQQAAQQLAEREQAAVARAAGLEESLTLAREQLMAANQRALALESSAQERDRESARLRARIESLEVSTAEARGKLDFAFAAHRAERTQLQERHAAAESHWLQELDRARQHTKEALKEHQNLNKELRRRVESLQGERDTLRQDLLETRAECKTSLAVREQLEQRLLALANRPAPREPTSSKTRRSPTQRPRKRSKA